MLKIHLSEVELFDSNTQMFITQGPAMDLVLEHSLISISKWESKWLKPFLVDEELPPDELKDYINCMVVQGNDNDLNIADRLTPAQMNHISEYIKCPNTATKIKANNSKGNREIITSELIYYWMISLNIPFECQLWHLNRLLTLINVCDIKNTPAKKMSKSEVMSRNKAMNAARKKAMNTSG